MKRLDIEWRHLDKVGNTCRRCSDTGKTLGQTVIELMRECAFRGVQVVYHETKLSTEEIQQSNMILINNMALESLLPQTSIDSSYCASCCEFTGKPTFCRTVEYQGRTYEDIPAALIREAVCRVADCC
ncbi:MAG: DUF2703 domain-containing protein [Sulfuricaulis sp.]